MASPTPPAGRHELVQRIRAAQHYVQPSQDLRPRLLEAAREARQARRRAWRLASSAIAAATLLTVGASWLAAPAPTPGIESADALSLDAAARQAEPRTETGPTFALVDWLRNIRARQAELLVPQRSGR